MKVTDAVACGVEQAAIGDIDAVVFTSAPAAAAWLDAAQDAVRSYRRTVRTLDDMPYLGSWNALTDSSTLGQVKADDLLVPAELRGIALAGKTLRIGALSDMMSSASPRLVGSSSSDM